jgi:putative heme iron utilization protein
MMRRLSAILPTAVLVAKTNSFANCLVPSCVTSSFRSALPTGTTTIRLASSSNPAATTSNEPRHDVGSDAQSLPASVLAQMNAYQQHQKSAAKLDWAAEIRTLVQYNTHGFAVMSTISKSDPGYPSGSVVGFAVEETTGRPVFLFSGMSTHTQDILATPQCSLTVAAKDFKGAADARVNLMGTCTRIRNADEIEQAKAIYQQKHPGAFWADFGDFFWYRMEVDKVRFVGGFARAGTITGEQYSAAKADVISQYSAPIAKHMNDDHMDATIRMVQTLVPGMSDTGDDDAATPKITEALITSVDSLGMYIKVTREAPVAFLPQQFKLRLPFPRPAVERKDVHLLMVEMTKDAAAATVETST